MANSGRQGQLQWRLAVAVAVGSGGWQGLTLTTLNTLNTLIKRIVKMTFREEAVPIFIGEVFENSKAKIRAFEGCRHMELLRHKTRRNILFTLSYWEDEAALEAYRASELFGDTWAKTKALFAEKAEAWTVEVIDEP